MFKKLFLISSFLFLLSCNTSTVDTSSKSKTENSIYGDLKNNSLSVKFDSDDKISVYRNLAEKPILTQNAKKNFRPFLHPIVSPNGKGLFTEYSPGHHKHQTGIYWGFTRVNGSDTDDETLKKWFYAEMGGKTIPKEIKNKLGRDFFHHPTNNFYNDTTDYWIRENIQINNSEGDTVSWEISYNMLDASGETIMVETQAWSIFINDGMYFLDLEWTGDAKQDITINEFEYGGLFVRMPWFKGIKGSAENGQRKINGDAEGEKSHWVNVGMEIDGMSDFGNITIFDNPQNSGFPHPWRVDGNLGVGPSRSIDGDWTINKGDKEIIKHRLIVHQGDFNDAKTHTLFEEYAGMYGVGAMWDIYRDEGYKEKFLGPEEAVKAMTSNEDFEVSAFAAEPLITQPMAFTWDDKGRLWIAENLDYETRGNGFSSDGNSKILILEDLDSDGKADTAKVFLSGVAFPSAIAVGFDGLYLGAPPNLIFIPDANQDDIGEVENAEILLTGWGIRDRHETINSFHWGPDGWLYGLEGFATPSMIRKPDKDTKLYGHNDPFPDDIFEKDGVYIDGGVWRFHPKTKEFEIVAHGFSNPWGIDYDSKGQMFITACVIPHAFHVVQGGVYHRQGGKHVNPYVYSDIRTIVDHRHRSAHGGARIYLSDSYPEEHYGKLFMANIHEHAVLSDELIKKGSSFIATHSEDFMKANNAQFIGFSMELGPDGNLYVLDWHDADICGNDVVHKDTGRLYKIEPKISLANNFENRYSDLNTLDDLELAEFQTNKSSWHARRARSILQKRSYQRDISYQSIDYLKNLLNNSENSDHRLRALWSLHVISKYVDADFEKLLNDKDEYIRGWSIKHIAEDKNVSDDILEKFKTLSGTDLSPFVRLELASAIQRVDFNRRWDVLESLVLKSQDIKDNNIPHMIWFALEPLVALNPTRSLNIANISEIPMITEYVARRLADAELLTPLVENLRTSNKKDILLEGMLASVEGNLEIKPPSNWDSVYDLLKKDNKSKEKALQISQLFGSNEATVEFIKILKDKSQSIEKRTKSLNSISLKSPDELYSIIPSLIIEKEMRIPAIRSIQNLQEKGDFIYPILYNYEDKGDIIPLEYEDFSSQEKLAIIQMMASQNSTAKILLNTLKSEKIPKRDVPNYVARQMRRVLGSGFLEYWGPLEKVAEEKMLAYNKYSALLTKDALIKADIAAGKQTYAGLCGQCHIMFGEGGKIGPELTGSNRTDLEYLLYNILNPNSDVQDDYLMVLVTTREGMTYAGNIVSENDRSITMRTVGQEGIVLLKSNIQSREVQSVSMMPEGLLDWMPDQEIINLIGFLQSSEEISSN